MSTSGIYILAVSPQRHLHLYFADIYWYTGLYILLKKVNTSFVVGAHWFDLQVTVRLLLLWFLPLHILLCFPFSLLCLFVQVKMAHFWSHNALLQHLREKVLHSKNCLAVWFELFAWAEAFFFQVTFTDTFLNVFISLFITEASSFVASYSVRQATSLFKSAFRNVFFFSALNCQISFIS